MKRLTLLFLVLLLAPPGFSRASVEEANRYLETMVASIREKNDPMRNRMFIKLRVLGEASVDPLLAGLADESPDVRRYLAFTLGFFDVPRTTEPLLQLFRTDPEVSVRTAAAEALGRLRRAEAVDPLISALGDPDPSVRQSAAYSLGLIGDPRARPALENAKADSDELVRFFAEEALVEIEREAARNER